MKPFGIDKSFYNQKNTLTKSYTLGKKVSLLWSSPNPNRPPPG
jgi:hypothetical protein